MPLLARQTSGEGALIEIPAALLSHILAGRVRYDAADVGGDAFNNDGKTFLHVKNGSVGPLTVTVAAKPTKTDAEKTVAPGGEEFFGPFPLTDFLVAPAITYSGVTSLTLAVLRI